MASPSLVRIERLNYGIGAIVVAVAAVTQPRAIALGLSVGVGLTCLNFFVLRKLVVKWTTDAAAGRSGSAPFLMLPKMVGLMGAVAVAVLVLPIDVIAFTIGYSIFMLSILCEILPNALRPQPRPPTESTEPSEHNHG